jgi:alpha-amylase/alpha-mannosidase (GH57 family)
MHKKYLCIHGHFYQPPRENPWLNAIEQQPSAAPYHDWNERINSDCYLPNAAARVLDNQGLVRSIVNNYRHISFNFGPTLLSWLEEHGQRTYAAILEADSDSRQRLGYGNAIAQVYNHIIMPLATRRDKEVQVAWGISDFVMRFGRQPEGMWLAETAVDMETLEVLAAAGIRFTILAPGQAAAFREADSDTWHSTDAGRGIDPTRPYFCKLASGEEINIFFYDGPLSHAIAFEKLLENGDRFYNRILNAYAAERQWSQLLHLATDGESYGHHFQNGEMALAYCLNLAEKDAGIEVVNYATYLHNHPALTEVRIVENSAWSCAHGVGRWQEDCGCNAGSIANANQRWRKTAAQCL